MTDSTVLVTGASRGIGRAIALRLAKDGFNIVVHYRNNREEAEKVAEMIKDYGVESRLLRFDIADRVRCMTALSADMDQYGAYYGVVCNAGIAMDNAFPAMSGEEWDGVIRTNLDGFYNVLQPVVMPMIRRRQPGRIVTLASVSGIAGNRGQTNYSAAKAGIIGASKALALELAKRQITVNCIAPGLIDTDMITEEVLSEAMKMIPLRRMGTVDEVASLAAYLMSKDAGYITRQVISVNGGMI